MRRLFFTVLFVAALTACAAEVRVDGPTVAFEDRNGDGRLEPIDETPITAVHLDVPELLRAIPIHAAPIDEAPIDEVPIDEAPIDEAPIDEAPIDEQPVDEQPVDEPPVEEPPVDDGGPVVAPPPPEDPSDHGSLSPGTEFEGTFIVNGAQRQAHFVVPTALANGKLPLVIVFHANGETDEQFINTLGLDALAESRGFVLVALKGQPRPITGVSTTPLAWDAYSEDAANLDMDFIDVAVPIILNTRSILAGRVTILGYSQGGFMAFRAAMDRSTMFAAAAVISASSPLGNSLVSNATRDIPMKMRIGANDTLLSNARSSRDALIAAGHDVDYEEVAGAAHFPFPGDPAPIIDWLLPHSL